MESIKGTVNRVELVGWLGAEPEQRFIPSGAAVISFRVATKRWVGRSDDGSRTVDTDWTAVEAWEAEAIDVSVRFGRRIPIRLTKLLSAGLAMSRSEVQRLTTDGRLISKHRLTGKSSTDFGFTLRR